MRYVPTPWPEEELKADGWERGSLVRYGDRAFVWLGFKNFYDMELADGEHSMVKTYVLIGPGGELHHIGGATLIMVSLL